MKIRYQSEAPYSGLYVEGFWGFTKQYIPTEEMASALLLLRQNGFLKDAQPSTPKRTITKSQGDRPIAVSPTVWTPGADVISDPDDPRLLEIPVTSPTREPPPLDHPAAKRLRPHSPGFGRRRHSKKHKTKKSKKRSRRRRSRRRKKNRKSK